MMVFGIGLDAQSRCVHYHSLTDIVALKCQVCQKYYACYHCHDEMENHPFATTDTSEALPVICGACRTFLSRKEYETKACPNCQKPFNPECARHSSIYFN
ncbi:CHY zinc finger protein [Streptococcus iniae]